MRTFFFFLLCCHFHALFCEGKQIAILVNSSWNGEHSLAWRIKRACKNIQWDADILYFPHLEKLYANVYDFAICLTPDPYKKPTCRCYLAIFHPTHHYFNLDGFLKKEFSSYDGYLLTFDPLSLKHKTNFNDAARFPYLIWYPSCERQPFYSLNPKKLFHILATWGERVENTKFRTLWHLLDQNGDCLFYGSRQFSSLYPKCYQGPLGFNDESIYRAIQKAGICLVIHSSDHNTYDLPSGRIFEAAASSAVIISDENSFVKKHFGDSVLYINTSADAPSIFSQIHNHLLWIQNNKESALKKAKQAFQINRDFFLLEQQLLKLGELHDRQK